MKTQKINQIVNGKREGLWRFWYKNGKLWFEEHYKNGLEEGLCKEWYPNGKLRAEGHYKNGYRHGKWVYCEN